jgi:hypothetical protein
MSVHYIKLVIDLVKMPDRKAVIQRFIGIHNADGVILSKVGGSVRAIFVAGPFESKKSALTHDKAVKSACESLIAHYGGKVASASAVAGADYMYNSVQFNDRKLECGGYAVNLRKILEKRAETEIAKGSTEPKPPRAYKIFDQSLSQPVHLDDRGWKAKYGANDYTSAMQYVGYVSRIITDGPHVDKWESFGSGVTVKIMQMFPQLRYGRRNEVEDLVYQWMSKFIKMPKSKEGFRRKPASKASTVWASNEEKFMAILADCVVIGASEHNGTPVFAITGFGKHPLHRGMGNRIVHHAQNSHGLTSARYYPAARVRVCCHLVSMELIKLAHHDRVYTDQARIKVTPFTPPKRKNPMNTKSVPKKISAVERLSVANARPSAVNENDGSREPQPRRCDTNAKGFALENTEQCGGFVDLNQHHVFEDIVFVDFNESAANQGLGYRVDICSDHITKNPESYESDLKSPVAVVDRQNAIIGPWAYAGTRMLINKRELINESQSEAMRRRKK